MRSITSSLSLHHLSRHHYWVWGLIPLLLLGLAGCATTADKMDRLNRTLRAYEKNIRWAKFDAAYSFHKWEAGEQPSIPRHLKEIRVTGYDVTGTHFDPKTMTATQTVSIRYYSMETSRERTLEDRQRWQYNEDIKRWQLISPPPTFP